MKWSINNIPQLDNKLAVVTGANSGLGFYTSKHLAMKGATVIMACRDEQKTQEAIAKITTDVPHAKLHYVPLDLTSLDSIAQCAQQIKANYPALDFLVNNAGVMMPATFSKTKDNFELQFGVNYLGHFSLTGQLLEHIKDIEGSRIVTLGSIAHFVGWIDLQNLNGEKRYTNIGAYGRSKLACIMFAYELDRRLKDQGKHIQSLTAHPGWASTNLQRHSAMFHHLNPVFAQSAEAGAMPTLRALTDQQAKGGQYYGPDGFMGLRGKPEKSKSKPLSHNKKLAAKLWSKSQQLTSLSYL